MAGELFPLSSNKGDQARRRLLFAALRVIGDRGYANASVREIAEEAGQNLAAISYYYSSKEGLYTAVLEGIGAYLAGIFGSVAEETRDRMAAGEFTSADAIETLKRMLGTLLGEQLEEGEFEKIRLVMIREQSAPSESYDVLYRKSLKPLHELFTTVLAVAIGADPAAPETILRAHALFGQVIVFTVARTTLLRRLGVSKLTPDHQAAIAGIIGEHVELLCAGLHAKHP